MPIFIILGNLTQDGVKGIKNLPKRQKMAEELTESIGGKILSLYYTFGQYDWVGVVEAPSIESAMKSLFMFGMEGASRTNTLVAITAEEAVKMVKEIP